MTNKRTVTADGISGLQIGELGNNPFSAGRLEILKGEGDVLWVVYYYIGLDSEATKVTRIHLPGVYDFSADGEVTWVSEDFEVLEQILEVFNVPPGALDRKVSTSNFESSKFVYPLGSGSNAVIGAQGATATDPKMLHSIKVKSTARREHFLAFVALVKWNLRLTFDFFIAWFTSGEKGLELARKWVADNLIIRIKTVDLTDSDRVRLILHPYGGHELYFIPGNQSIKVDGPRWDLALLTLCNKFGYGPLLSGQVRNQADRLLAVAPQLKVFGALSNEVMAVQYLIEQRGAVAMYSPKGDIYFAFGIPSCGPQDQHFQSLETLRSARDEKNDGPEAQLFRAHPELEYLLLASLPMDRKVEAPALYPEFLRIQPIGEVIYGFNEGDTEGVPLFRSDEAVQIDSMDLANLRGPNGWVAAQQQCFRSIIATDGYGRGFVFGNRGYLILNIQKGMKRNFPVVIQSQPVEGGLYQPILWNLVVEVTKGGTVLDLQCTDSPSNLEALKRMPGHVISV